MSYGTAKLKKLGDFHARTWLIFADLVTNVILLLAGWVDKCKDSRRMLYTIFAPVKHSMCAAIGTMKVSVLPFSLLFSIMCEQYMAIYMHVNAVKPYFEGIQVFVMA